MFTRINLYLKSVIRPFHLVPFDAARAYIVFFKWGIWGPVIVHVSLGESPERVQGRRVAATVCVRIAQHTSFIVLGRIRRKGDELFKGFLHVGKKLFRLHCPAL